MATLKVGLMGLGRGGWRVARALMDSPWCQLVAVSSLQAQRIERFKSQHPGIATFDDFRSMIVSSPLEALFVAVPPYLRPKYLPLAGERKIPVWMLTPPARCFDEALQLIALFEKAGCPIVVSRSWGVEPALQPDAIGLNEIGRFFLARGHVMLSSEPDLDWRGDSQRAGGGVLLHEAYSMIDTVVQVMGLPGTVYAKLSGASRPSSRFPYDTEDTAGLLGHYPGGAMAVLSACWTTGPACRSLDLHGLGGSIHIDGARVEVRDRTGEIEVHRLPRPGDPLEPQIEVFLSELAASPRRLRGTLRQHLPALAVIQAAYLSARTGQPESPGAIFRMHDLKEPGPPGAR